MNEIKLFRKVLLNWFDIHRRVFPWRKEGISNYEVVLSEILLQRTRAETVAKYYYPIFTKYPNWESIINLNTEELERIFKPLGLYKQRAKRLSKIIEEFRNNGDLPISKSSLMKSNLSSLYLSNSYNLLVLNNRAALLDVNMSRVLSRFFKPQKFKDVRLDKSMQKFASEIIDVARCKELNWAILDFAALVCRTSSPKCFTCPLRKKCKYYKLIKSSWLCYKN